jgi:hypothetical protein
MHLPKLLAPRRNSGKRKLAQKFFLSQLKKQTKKPGWVYPFLDSQPGFANAEKRVDF